MVFPEGEPQVSNNEACTHRWVINTANGAVSHGVCKKCGSVKSFPNAVEEKFSNKSDWDPFRGGLKSRIRAERKSAPEQVDRSRHTPRSPRRLAG